MLYIMNRLKNEQKFYKEPVIPNNHYLIRGVNIMQHPKNVKKFCKFCGKHTEQKVSQNKKRKPRSHSKGSKIRRGFDKGSGNLGTRGSKPAISKFKMANRKISKKTDLRYQCNECRKSTVQAEGVRAKKVEFQ